MRFRRILLKIAHFAKFRKVATHRIKLILRDQISAYLFCGFQDTKFGTSDDKIAFAVSLFDT